MAKCVNCGETMIPHYSRDGMTIFVCPNARLTTEKEGMIPYGYMYCDLVRMHRGKDVKLFKEQLKSKLVKTPLPKEEYKRIENAIKKLGQADVNDILYNLQSEESNLKNQIEKEVRERIDLSSQVENAFDLYAIAFILKTFADKVGLEIGLPKDSNEFMKSVIKAASTKA